jgi:hypothetical protein
MENEAGRRRRPRSALMLSRAAAVVAAKRLDRAQEYQTEPKIDEHTQVGMHGAMAGGGRKMWHEQKVHQVAGHDRNQRFQKVSLSLFGHRRTRLCYGF